MLYHQFENVQLTNIKNPDRLQASDLLGPVREESNTYTHLNYFGMVALWLLFEYHHHAIRHIQDVLMSIRAYTSVLNIVCNTYSNRAASRSRGSFLTPPLSSSRVSSYGGRNIARFFGTTSAAAVNFEAAKTKSIIRGTDSELDTLKVTDLINKGHHRVIVSVNRHLPSSRVWLIFELSHHAKKARFKMELTQSVLH